MFCLVKPWTLDDGFNHSLLVNWDVCFIFNFIDRMFSMYIW